MDNDQFLLAQIQRAITPKHGEDEAWFEHADTGRHFHVRLQPAGYHVSEIKPNGRFLTNHKKNLFEDDDRFLSLVRDNPNGLKDALDTCGRTWGQVCGSGSGFGVGSIYHPGIAEAAAAILSSIRHNVWHKSSLTTEERQAMQGQQGVLEEAVREAGESVAYWNGRVNSNKTPEGIFAGTASMYGGLSEQARRSLLSFMNDPTEAHWQDCHCYAVTGGGTQNAWSVWVAYDPSAPRSKPLDGPWPSIPTPEILLKAIQAAVEADQKEALERQMEAERRLKEAQQALADFQRQDGGGQSPEPVVIRGRFGAIEGQPVIRRDRLETMEALDNSQTTGGGPGLQ